MAPQRAPPPPSGVVVGLLPKADALKKLEAERTTPQRAPLPPFPLPTQAWLWAFSPRPMP